MTEFLDDHPGGKEIIMNNRSKDVTPIFNPRHPSDQLEPDNIPPNVRRLGTLDLDDATDEEKSGFELNPIALHPVHWGTEAYTTPRALLDD